MRASSSRRPPPELPSSPPAPAPVGSEDTTTPAKNWPSSSNLNNESALSDTETLGPSSPDLPPLSALPRIGLTPKTPQAALSSEGTFYTASWGSPYDAPPDNTGGSRNHHHRSSTASIDGIEEDSPNHQFGLSHLIPSRLTKNYDITPTRPSTPSQLSPEETPRSSGLLSIVAQGGESPSRRLVAAFSKYSRLGPLPWASREQQRRNSTNNNPSDWVADSDLTHTVQSSKVKRHRSRKSNLTLRQEDILPSSHLTRDTADMENSKYATPPKAKAEQPPPPPNYSNQSSLQPASPLVTDRITPPLLGDRRTSTLSVHGSKKRVMYKGKGCWIGIPVDPPRGGEGQPPIPLSASELSARLAGFEKAGYDTRGFGHWRSAETVNVPDDHAQNVRIYPDPREQWEEGNKRNFRVRFANKSTWDDYVKFLTEERLRLLGVSVGGDEPEEVPMSRQTSSQFGSHPFSPPLPTSSAGSQRLGQAGNGFPVGFVPGSSNHTSTRSIASPISSIGNARASLHMHRQSMFISPTNAPHQAMSPTGFTSWSPQPFGSHHMPQSTGSPAISNQMSGHRSPISPYNAAPDASNPFPFAQRDELLAQMQRQQQQQLMKQQQQMLLARSSTLAEVPEAEVEEEKAPQAQSATPEIVNPKPGHRHNISAKLEENIKNAGYRLETYTQKQGEKPNESIQSAVEEEASGPSADTPVNQVPEWRKKAPEPSAEEAQSLPKTIEQPSTKALASPKAVEGVGRTYGLEQTYSEVDTNTDNEFDGDKDSKLASSTRSNPWANDSTFQPKVAPSNPPITKRHSSKFSFSKLNVEAKEFNPSANPSATFNPGIFSSSSFAFQPAKAKPFIPRSAREFSPASPPVSTTFNVNAPAFSPSSLSGLSSSEFSFATKGPVFKPTAPVFQPMGSSDRSRVTSDSDSSTRIFSNINLAEIVTPPKSSKAVPIRTPTAQELRQINDLGEDEDGRVTQENVKRTRRFGDDGDDVPLFAMPNPLPLEPVSLAKRDTEDDVDELQGNAANEMSTTLVMDEDAEAVSGASPTAEKFERNVHTPATSEEAVVSPIAEEQSRINDNLTAQRTGDGRASPDISLPEDEDEPDTSTTLPEMKQTSRVTSASSVLSALARPFSFQLPLVMESEQKPQPRSTPVKQKRSVGQVGEPLLSPPSSSTANKSDSELIDARSTRLSPSRLPSSVRYYDDLEQPSFQEIDAVMQQFNEGGSDFGIERDDRSWPDSSVKDESTRQLDNVPDLAAKLRSDAPSPSPRRALLRPILPVEVDSASATQDPLQ